MLRPSRMTKLEVITPRRQIDDIIRVLGRLGVVHFIDITDKNEYVEVTKEITKPPREDYLQQVSNRLGNIMRKLGDIPYPAPVIVKENPEGILDPIEKNIASLELQAAQLENTLKEMTEEKATLNREISQVNEEYESIKVFLKEYGIDTATGRIPIENTSDVKRSFKGFQERLSEIQKNIQYVAGAVSLTTSQQPIPNEEAALFKLRADVEAAKLIHAKVQQTLRDSDKLSSINDILAEIDNVVQKKLDALDRLHKIKIDATALKREIQKLNSELTESVGSFLHQRMSQQLADAAKALEVVEQLTFDPSDYDVAVERLPKSTQEIIRLSEALVASERFQVLNQVKQLNEEIRSRKPEDVDFLLEKTRSLMDKMPTTSLTLLERVLRILHYEKRLQDIDGKAKDIQVELSEIGKKSSMVHVHKELVDIELRIMEVKKKFRETEKTAVFEIWTKKADVEVVSNAIRNVSPSGVIYKGMIEKGERPPTSIAMPQFLRPPQELTNAIGLPNYNELNPALIMAVTFPIIYGMMYPDMGQGLFILIGAFLVKPVFKKLKVSGPMWNPIVQGRTLIAFMGVASIFFGILYGDFFGATTLEDYREHPTPLGPLYSLVVGLGDPERVPSPPWFAILSPHTNMVLGSTIGPFILLKISIIIAAMQLVMGFIINLINKIMVRDYKHASASATRLWLQVSVLYVIISPAITVKDLFMNPMTMVIYMLLPLIGMIVVHRYAAGNLFHGVSEGIEGFIQTISHTASYARILALAMVHATFNKMALMGSGPLFWPIFLMMNILLLIALNGVLAFGHTLRLHWVEWFSKFYQGEGSRFEVFAISRRFTKTA